MTQGEINEILLEKKEGMWADSSHRYSLDTKQTPKVHVYMHAHMHAHAHTCELQRSANQAHKREVNMTAKSHFIELTLKSPSPGPSSVKKGTHRQKELNLLDTLLTLWQKAGAPGRRA